MTADPWPWPADTPLDRARRIAQSYREALAAIAPDRCAQLDDRAREYGQDWVTPQLVTFGMDDLLTAIEAAELAGVTAQVIYQWAYRGHLPRCAGPDGSTRYRAGDVLDHVARTRRRRAATRVVGQQRV
ncbi:helix-turn-helix domain-containing protein [Rhodococcus zopfii]|uniref:helix-turn-helix domain-containing protein n=1 Tax=Rhodococcus zopfii TaxID=43772 RepID=UPI0009327213|nr:helix-turn-helix domain-containing protein [Rhodococcus zopfii]